MSVQLRRTASPAAEAGLAPFGSLPSRRSILPLLVIGIGSGRSGWLEGRPKLVKVVLLIQDLAKGAAKEILGEDPPYDFTVGAHGPTSESLLNDVKELVERGLVDSESFSVDPDGVVVGTRYRLSPKGKRVMNALGNEMDVLVESNPLRKRWHRRSRPMSEFIEKMTPLSSSELSGLVYQSQH